MADMFRAAGYATANVGKWHLGYTPETMPLARGFHRSFGHMGASRGEPEALLRGEIFDGQADPKSASSTMR